MSEMVKFQMEAFKRTVDLSRDLQSIAGYIQNGFERMLEDGSATPQDISNTLLDVEREFKDLNIKLGRLENSYKMILEHYGVKPEMNKVPKERKLRILKRI